MKKSFMAKAIFEDACDKSVALRNAYLPWVDDEDNVYSARLWPNDPEKWMAGFLREWANEIEGVGIK